MFDFLFSKYKKLDSQFNTLNADVDAHKADAAPHSGHETPSGAQAKANAAEANAKLYAENVANSALNSAKNYADDVLESANSHTDQVASDLSHKLNETRIKVLDVEQDISNISKVLTNLNPNQEAKQTISDYGIVPLPVNAANGHMDVAVGGNTEIDEDGMYHTVSAIRLRSVGKNLFRLGNISDYIYNTSTNIVVDAGLNQLSGRVGSGATSWAYIVKPYRYNGETITLSASFSGDPRWLIRFLDENFNNISAGRTLTNAGYNSYYQAFSTNYSKFTFSIPYSDVRYIQIGFVFFSSTAVGSVQHIQNIQIERGSATNYEPYTESALYIPDVGELRSVPNGTADEISGGQLIQRVKTIAITAQDIRGLGTTGVNIDWVVIRKPTDYIGYGTSGYATGTFTFGNYTEKRMPTLDLPENINCIDSYGPEYFYLVIPKGTYADLNAAKTALAGTKLTYQLAEPIITPINVSGTLLSYPKGTVYAEPVLPVAGIYTANGISVTNTDFPIESIEHIYKIDFTTGVETEIDPSSAVVSGDRLSFTHPDLAEGDIVFFTYYHDVTGTNPKITVTYYDSRYTVKDSITGKFYEWSITVANGVPSISLQEV